MSPTILPFRHQPLSKVMIHEGIARGDTMRRTLYWVDAVAEGRQRRQFYRGYDYEKALHIARSLGVDFVDDTFKGMQRECGGAA